jgi:soluble lytic murein transglycosylase-like protein
MKPVALLLCLFFAKFGLAQAGREQRQQAEYYVAAYAEHYRVPLALVRAVIEEESGWRLCPVSPKGAAGLMQLMPQTALRLKVRNRCDIQQNISGGVRYLAWLMSRFRGDLRLVTAAYYAGEIAVARRGLSYANQDVIAYVASVRERFVRQAASGAVVPSRNVGKTP